MKSVGNRLKINKVKSMFIIIGGNYITITIQFKTLYLICCHTGKNQGINVVESLLWSPVVQTLHDNKIILMPKYLVY